MASPTELTVPGGGGTQRLPRLVGKCRALQLILSGEMISAQEAYRIVLVDEIVPAADLIARAEAILNKIVANAPIAVKLALEVTRQGTGDESRAKGCCSKLPISASARRPKTKRRAHPPSSKSARPSSTGAEEIRCSRECPRRPQWQAITFSQDLKVVDFASFIAGPSAAVILSDFGADVVKVGAACGDFWRIGQTSAATAIERRLSVAFG